MTTLAPVTNIPAEKGFVDASAAKGAIAPTEAGAIAVVAREEAELKAAITLARLYPRNESTAEAAIIACCKRPSFAEKAYWCFPRGGSAISGPSVNLARQAARCWGNIRYGLRIVSEDDERVHVVGWAHDAQTNTGVAFEDKFAKRVQRKVRGPQGERRTQWVEPDERDLRELVNRRGAICVRNALLQLLPPDVIDEAINTATQVSKGAAAGELQTDRASTLRHMILAFQDLGVTPKALSSFLGHPFDEVDEEELAKLRGVYASIRDGATRREDHFVLGPPPATPEKALRTESLVSELKDGGRKKTTNGQNGSSRGGEQIEPEPVADNLTADTEQQRRMQQLRRKVHEAYNALPEEIAHPAITCVECPNIDAVEQITDEQLLRELLGGLEEAYAGYTAEAPAAAEQAAETF